ncbi:Tigger transposable element-derived protein 4, partial [Araneus ventricosus]
MTGHQKLKPLVIGRSKNPRCFKDAKSLEVDYDFNKKSWMTSEICEKWVKKLDKRMIAECRKIALVFDNCLAHPKEINPKLKNATVLYLPPNATSELESMDQGVIKNFKIHYRKRIVRKVISALENNQSMPKINLWESISEISKAWNYDMSQIVLFAKVLPKLDSLSAMRIRQVRRTKTIFPQRKLKKKMWLQLREKEEINDDVLIDDFLSLDSEAETSETLTELDIVDSVKNKNNTAMNCDEEEDDGDGSGMWRASHIWGRG